MCSMTLSEQIEKEQEQQERRVERLEATAEEVRHRDERVERLMRTRIEPPRRVQADTPVVKPWHWHVFWYVRLFLLNATWRSVTSAIGRHALRRPLGWLWEHGYMFLTTTLSRKASDEVYHARMKICVECGQSVPRAGYLYCRACGCPAWLLARLDGLMRVLWWLIRYGKNWKSGHNCPLGLHPGSVAIRKGTANGD